MLLEGVILTCAEHIKTKRTTSAIYHLLTGKRSIQTVQDAHLYDIQPFYGIGKFLHKKTFDAIIHQLEQKALLSIDEASGFKLTEQGEWWLKEHAGKLSFEHFHGMHYHALADTFSDRLLLFIQTLTNSSKGNFSFIPVVDKMSVQAWVKQFYRNNKKDEAVLLHALYNELHRILSTCQTIEAGLFVDRLTGFKNYGKSRQQLADYYQIPVTDVPLLWTRIMNRMVSIVQHDQHEFPTLFAMIDNTTEQTFITDSANRTYQMLKRHYSVEAIADRRRLKVNTIYDHIVEIALCNPAFPVTPFITNEQYTQIVDAMKQINSFSLKQLKQVLPDEISYFQIRLVLATVKNLSIK
ncbi:helix-turn-helix domain-containing protein [Lentibacillus sp. Marseille-P4043]|uniref:helix-turn-helix domain-containing protein n=1 Tax=Lentibacillus sp. Marseille-P4043 TaxID=2040293 RepID=UPI000D0BAC5F|nr:helix-turn-helix domain-containing protein [Lentibacillus sp. Marseille-P4043]